jgi:purine-nucleoside phosphorylase
VVSTETYEARLARLAIALHARLGEGPFTVVVLGSGMSGVAGALEGAEHIPYSDIEEFPRPTVSGHAGVLVAGRLHGQPTVLLQGRFHLYEGHAPGTIVLPLRALIRLGVRTLIQTNAAGGLNPRIPEGSLMLVDDHINMLAGNPLTGPVQRGEQRFPDLSEPYDRGLQQLAAEAARELGIRLERGVYCAVTGPSYETPAEVAMLRRLGGDAVGMSTVPETLVARAAGVPVLAISLITNMATGLRNEPLSHAEVVAAGHAAQDRLSALLNATIRRLHRPAA